jgi:stage V sporulation protein AA
VVSQTTVHLKDVATVFCNDLDIQNEVEKMRLFSFHKEMDGRQVITILKVIEQIQEQYPQLLIINLGDPEFIVFHKKPQEVDKKNKSVEITKILFVCVVSFFGAAFTIMTYNNDVGVNEVFSNLYSLFMGYAPQGPTVLQLSYAVGLTVGLFFFFNHVSHHRLTDDPTPLEVEMRLYERDVNDTVAISSGRNKKTLDVG